MYYIIIIYNKKYVMMSHSLYAKKWQCDIPNAIYKSYLNCFKCHLFPLSQSLTAPPISLSPLARPPSE